MEAKAPRGNSRSWQPALRGSGVLSCGGDAFLNSSAGPKIIFEDNAIGRLKQQLVDGPIGEIDSVLKEYLIPSASGLGKAAATSTPPVEAIKKRRKNAWCSSTSAVQ